MKQTKERWIFADWRSLNDEKLKSIEYMQVSDVVLGVNLNDYKQYKTFKLMIDHKIIERDALNLKQLGIKTTIMVWLRRNKQYIKTMNKELLSFFNKYPDLFRSLLLDAEGNWIFGSNITSIQGRDLIFSELHELEIPIGTTSFAIIPKSVIPLAEHSKYVIPQAYAVYHPSNPQHFTRKKSKKYAPITLQNRAFNSWKNHCDNICMGQGAYWLKRPGYPGISALKTSCKATENMDVFGQAFWSLKFMDEEDKAIEKAIMDFIRTLAIQTNNNIKTIQWFLVELGYGEKISSLFKIDGIWGNLSQKALDTFRNESQTNLEEIGQFFSGEDLFNLSKIYIKSRNYL